MGSSVIAILLLGWLIVVHELGHFLVARWAGVRILRFSVGFGPTLLAWTRGATEYAISAIPLGGYVKMAGEQRAEETPPPSGGDGEARGNSPTGGDGARSAPEGAPPPARGAPRPWEYRGKPLGVRALIIFAGPLVNYLVALLSLWVVFMVGFPELLPVVGKVMEDMPAQAAGLASGDRIDAVNGKPVRTWEEMTKAIYGAPGVPLTLRVTRDGASRSLTVTPKARTITDPFSQRRTVGLIGISPSGQFEAYRLGPWDAAARTMQQQHEWVAQTFLAFWFMLTGKLSLNDSVTGPIGIVYLTSEAMRMGFAPLLFLISLFSLSLAIVNLFPIPILDGGHLFFLLMEKLRGRPISLTIQERSAQVSFLVLMGLVLVICLNDIQRFGLLDKVAKWFGR